MAAQNKTTVVIVENNSNVLHAIKFLLEGSYNFNVIAKKSLNITEISTLFDEYKALLQLVICEHNQNFDSVPIAKFISRLSPFPIFISTDADNEGIKNLAEAEVRLRRTELIPSLKTYIDENFKIDSEYQKQEYTPVSIQTICHFDALADDIYIKLKSGRYLKLYREGDRVTEKDVQRYLEKGVEYLHLNQQAHRWVLKVLGDNFHEIATNPNLDLKNIDYKVDEFKKAKELAALSGEPIRIGEDSTPTKPKVDNSDIEAMLADKPSSGPVKTDLDGDIAELEGLAKKEAPKEEPTQPKSALDDEIAELEGLAKKEVPKEEPTQPKSALDDEIAELEGLAKKEVPKEEPTQPKSALDDEIAELEGAAKKDAPKEEDPTPQEEHQATKKEEEEEAPPSDPGAGQSQFFDILNAKTKSMAAKLNSNKSKAALPKNINIARDDDSFISTRTNLVILIASNIAKELDWDSISTYEKIVYVAHVHDISISDNIALAKCFSKKELEGLALSDEDNERFLSHVDTAMKMIAEDANAPADVLPIIEQHHETPDRKGLKRISHQRVTPYSALFAVSLDIAQYIIENPNWNIKSWCKDNATKWRGGPYSKIMSAIKELTL